MNLPGPAAIPVVFDVTVLVAAAAGGNSPFRSWPSPPPTSGNPAADSLGVIVDGAEFALWLSPHLLGETRRVLLDVLLWAPGRADTFLGVVQAAARRSGGDLLDPPRTGPVEGRDREDNSILDLVVEVGALILVSADPARLALPPWGDGLTLTPTQFVARVAAMRRRRP